MQIEGAVDVTAMLSSGVYILLYRGAIVYIGKSKLMLTRVYSHRSMQGRKRTEAQPRGISFDQVFVIPAAPDRMDALERRLIARYKPRYNMQYNNGLPPDIAALLETLVPASGPRPEPRLIRRF